MIDATLLPIPSTTSVPVEPITLQQAKDHLRVWVADDDDYITTLITTARMMLEGRINRLLVHTEVTEVVDGFTNGMPLTVAPYADGLMIEYVDVDGNTQVYDGPMYLDTRLVPARVYQITGESWPQVMNGHGAVTLRYHAGYNGNVPAPLVHWMKLAIGTMYEHRAGVVAGVPLAQLPDDFMKCLYQKYVVYK